jgi:hypothetical protein
LNTRIENHEKAVGESAVQGLGQARTSRWSKGTDFDISRKVISSCHAETEEWGAEVVKKPWERFGPLTIDLRPLDVNGIQLLVTRIPAFTTLNASLVFPPFSALEALEYGAMKGLALPTAEVLDAVRRGSWWHAPITSGYSTNGDMQSDSVVLDHGRRWTLAMNTGGYDEDDFAVNVTKAWIADAVVFDRPGFGINRGYWMAEKDKDPIQKRGQAHPSTYRDVAQGGWFVKATPEYLDAIRTGKLGNKPFEYEAFAAATRGAPSTKPVQSSTPKALDNKAKPASEGPLEEAYSDVSGFFSNALAWIASLFTGSVAGAEPAMNPKNAELHRWAAGIVRPELTRLLGRAPSDYELQYGMGVGFHEGTYGRGKYKVQDGAPQPQNNWGAVQCGKGQSDCAIATDSFADQTEYQTGFRNYPTPNAGAADMLRHVFQKRPRTADALRSKGATAMRASLAMRRERYYEGWCPGAKKQYGGEKVRGSLSNPDKTEATRACQEEAVITHAKSLAEHARHIAGALGHSHALPLGTFEDAMKWYRSTYPDAAEPPS